MSKTKSNNISKIKNGSYYNIYKIPGNISKNNEDLNKIALFGAIIQTTTHSNVIKAGNDLENALLVESYWDENKSIHLNGNHFFSVKKEDEFKNFKFPENGYIIYHNPHVHIIDNGKMKRNDPDLIIVSSYKEIFIVELKLGDNFDTKKSRGEREKLDKICNIFRENFPKDKNIKVTPRFVCWRCKDKKDASIKDEIAQTYLQLGKDFCIEFSINKVDVDSFLNIKNPKRLLQYSETIIQLYHDIIENKVISRLKNLIYSIETKEQTVNEVTNKVANLSLS